MCKIKISKITKKQAKDIVVRVLKTFIAAAAVVIGKAIATGGFKSMGDAYIPAATAGVTAVINLIIKLCKEE